MGARRQSLADFRRELGESVRRSKRSARCIRALTSRIDEELCRLWIEAMTVDVGAGALLGQACLVATGGYGRKQLFPDSDIDVLVLCSEGRRPELDKAVRAFLAAAWDLGLELAQAVRKGTVAEQRHELSDVLAWLASLAHQLDLSLEDAAPRYAQGCPRCAAIPCACP